MSPLHDSTIFIVGGDRGLGLLVARRLVELGAQRIGLIGRDVEQGEIAAKGLFESASGIWALSGAGNLSSNEDACRVVTELVASLGDADILIDCLPGDNAVTDVVLQSMHALGNGTVVNVGGTLESDSGGVRVRSVALDEDLVVANEVLDRLRHN
ncbi:MULTISPECIES: SDR family NAD(P)-dependent oxidoreductase [Rhodococcus]|uniref:SDR family NAD(P)-dependent oxidoreductase n=1 Tax=Rhodococcus oxybenzonivorans TaxID=1990687 RepID=A0AAE4UWX4_9NOCA|nr:MULTISPECIES: SDR family NAD(P)-dependent oxidoreductase [Rhodococcus]MDV7241622.1 SDR family NAD(P)-dependent oxidoreductase [Rhodococcus oxybenzonivorans]MDV7264207.1 SDR family NAD(P)-dependent oxidoreductase [Rhodococcus oxybenzonivorans]MDV7273845.1 SDR family NAD(P)-dependent oxidoreductase [Rhodococcus oxybenzonivorans]MDV7333903.1 SDR family NAD(P)-dependent oxidoreductase [Rhodococcus oxybenzonivorans]MDV7343322.1 SDR family NAD(P)-dependent oxidoreductase [Rhodococcus oxybenzonivo